METTAIRSQATSGALHFIFLLLAFSAPVVQVLDVPEQPVTVRSLEFDAPARHEPQARFRLEPGRRGPGRGPEEPLGPKPPAKVGPTDDADVPELAGVTSTEFEDLRGVLAGVGDETVGPDAEMALGRLDGGGGSGPVFGLGMRGSGASCGRVWETDRRTGKTISRRVETCKRAIGIAVGAARGVLGRRAEGSREVTPDLGEKDEAAIGVEAGEPEVQCGSDRLKACDWREVIGRVVRRHRRELEHCWERSLEEQGREIDAELEVTFSIRPDGGEAVITVAEPTGLGELDDCVRERASRWQFPQTGNWIRANYPFRFWSR